MHPPSQRYHVEVAALREKGMMSMRGRVVGYVLLAAVVVALGSMPFRLLEAQRLTESIERLSYVPTVQQIRCEQAPPGPYQPGCAAAAAYDKAVEARNQISGEVGKAAVLTFVVFTSGLYLINRPSARLSP